MNTSTTYTIASYATIVGVIGLGFYLHQQKTAKNQTGAGQRKETRNIPTEPRKENRAKKQRLETYAPDAQEASDKARKSKAKANPAKSERNWLSNAANSSDDDGIDNKEFAKQFSSVKEGTKFTNKSGGEQKRQKSVKQSHANKVAEFADDETISVPSSTAGVDADDDQSLTQSPEVTAADAGDVSDMLEPAPAGPSVLRIVDTDKVKERKPKKANAPEPVETKKQRQNRKKAEQAKAQREEAEKERQVKMEQQRRLARISEGRPAKDGSQFMAQTNGGKQSAWAAGAPNGGPKKEPDTGSFIGVVPLDTFESTASSENASTSQSQNLTDSWITTLPSEEEQMEKLKEQTEEWSTVKPKASKKVLQKEPQAEKTEKVEEIAEPAQTRPAQQPVKKPQNGKSTKPAQSYGGSFAALSSNDNIEETEWDV